MKLSLAIQTPEVEAIVPVALLSGSFPEKLNKAAQWGAQGVELMTTEPFKLDWDEINTSLKSHNLEVCAVASGANVFALGLTLLHPDPVKAKLAEKRLFELIDFAESVGSPLVTIGGFRGRLASGVPNAKDYLIEILRQAAEYARQRSIRLVLEPLNRYENDLVNNAQQGLQFLQEVDHPALGLLLDTFHVNIEECSWTEPFVILMQAQKLWHVHLGDNNRLPPGKGLIDFHAITSTLRRIGYTGYLSAELLALPDADTAAKQTLTRMQTILLETQ